ncbi:MAG: hypothetical protein GYB41_00755 [Oceanospirillales bacterium]|nr:hypothetical protein [Oceanospirillales bacterium]
MSKSISFKISYHNGEASNGRLNMYDASVSLQGFAKALSITTHALLNNGEVRRKGHNVQGAEIFINPSRKGSFEELITIVVNNPEVIGVGIITNAFYDILKTTWCKTLDLIHDPETATVKRLQNRIEPFIGEMEESLESSLEQAHRPIKSDEEMVIVIKRHGSREVLRLDSDTLQRVSIKTEADIRSDIIGNATRYNILSGYGKFYDDQEQRVIPFKLMDSFPENKKQLITWSMHHAQNEEGQGKLRLTVQRVLSAKGVIKRYLVHDASQSK